MVYQLAIGKMNDKLRFADFSSLSVICSVDKFVKAVDSMNETIMVPSRLLNVDLTSYKEEVPDLLKGATDPYSFYSLLNNVKNNLVYGQETDESIPEKPINDNEAWFSPESTFTKTNEIKGHFRRISSVSMASVLSSSSEAECERLSDGGDSGVEGDREEVETMGDVTACLKTHLMGVQNCLKRLTQTANYITEKYIDEVRV